MRSGINDPNLVKTHLMFGIQGTLEALSSSAGVQTDSESLLPLEQGPEVQWSIFFSQLNPAYPVGHWQK